jgi:hypothetical protein
MPLLQPPSQIGKQPPRSQLWPAVHETIPPSQSEIAPLAVQLGAAQAPASGAGGEPWVQLALSQ